MLQYMTTLETPKTILLPDKSIISFQMQGGRSAGRACVHGDDCAGRYYNQEARIAQSGDRFQ